MLTDLRKINATTEANLTWLRKAVRETEGPTNINTLLYIIRCLL